MPCAENLLTLRSVDASLPGVVFHDVLLLKDYRATYTKPKYLPIDIVAFEFPGV